MNAKLIGSAISVCIYGTYYLLKYAGPKIAKKVLIKRAEKEAKLRAMDAEAIDVEWRVVEEF